MCALAGLPARAAARLRTLEAGAPALAASATRPLRLEDLLDAADLLTPLLMPDLIDFASFEGSITLQDARYFYEGASAAVASTLASVARRFVWRDLLPAQRELPLQTSSLLLPFQALHTLRRARGVRADLAQGAQRARVAGVDAGWLARAQHAGEP